MQYQVQVGCVVCTPIPFVRNSKGQLVKDRITADWHRARHILMFPTNFNVHELMIDGLEVGVARDQAARACLKEGPNAGPEFLTFLDYDVIPSYDAFTKLIYRLRCFPEIDVACGIYCCKYMNPPDPLIYKHLGGGAFWDWAIGDLLTTEQHGVRYCHMGLTVIRVSLFQKMIDQGIIKGEEPFFKTEVGERKRGTEDIFFMEKARQAGCQLLVDTSVLAGHIDRDGIIWGLPPDCPPVKRAAWLACKTDNSGTIDQEEGLKLALDLGAGSLRRTWPGYKTYTTDIRKDTNPDYVQDTRHLNLPNEHFSLVASSHHLEHIPRWEQEKVWGEIFKVCKSGGTIEHIVPNLEWAAHKIVQNDLDGDVFNVLYGAQEAHGYERIFNLHYFGYTPTIAKALAEQAGFTDITCEDWHSNPDLGYNLIIRGKKPEIIQTSICEKTPTVNGEAEKPKDNKFENDKIDTIAHETCITQAQVNPEIFNKQVIDCVVRESL